MIKIEMMDTDKGYSLAVSGHADYAPEGQDIVCAAVSVLAQTLANKVDAAARSGRLLTSCVQHGETFVVQALPKPGPNNLMVASWFDFVEEGLRALAEAYPDNVELMVTDGGADDMDEPAMKLQMFAEGGGAGEAAADGEAAAEEKAVSAPAQSKRYVEHHATEFGEGAAEKGSEAYWEAVNKMYQRVIEETQPNYTTMQRAGIQRSDNEFVKTLTMFTTQRFQNYGILADAVGDYKAQKARYAADQSAENKAEVQRAGQGLRQAAASQVVQTAVFALMKIGADFLLHRWDREQDKNGDVTAKSLGKRFFDLYTESAAGNFLYGSEIYSALTNARDGKDYDVVSATNISAVNDLFAAFTKTVKLLRTDTGEMSEEELTAHHQKLNKAVLKDIQCGLELYGVPAANIRKVMQAFEGYWENAQAIGRGEGFSFNSAPSSATGQYDRLYNAIQSGDSEEAAAAMKKLEQMNKTDKVDGELARRLKQYDADVLAAAEARNAGKTRAEEKARKAVFEKLREGLDVAPVTDRAKGKADAARRAQLIDLVNKAVDGKADELLAGGKDGSIYDALLDEVKNGRVEDAQEELDRLMTAGKDKGSIKSKITESVKEEYLAGSDRDREKLEKKLLALEDAEGKPLYEEKNFAQWVSAADKKAEKAKDEKNWWEGVK